MLKLSEWSVENSAKLSCKSGDDEFKICGECQSCTLKSRLRDSSQWLWRAGDASKRRFLTGILLRCGSLEILQRVHNVLRVTLGKDFTYSRSSHNPVMLEDREDWDLNSDRALDTKQLGQDMVQTWEWFNNSPDWTKTNYVLRILCLCDTALLHALGNLVRVLIARKKLNFLQFRPVSAGIEGTRSFTEKPSRLHVGEPELDFSTQISSDCESSSDVYETQTNNSSTEILDNSKPKKSSWGELEDQKAKWDDPDLNSCEDPALMVLPTSSKSTSGLSLYRDFIRSLPVEIAKRILGLLDSETLQSCKGVSKHWQYLAEEIVEELQVIKMLENKVKFLQGSSSGVNPAYAKIREVLVPLIEEEKDIQAPQISNKKETRGLESVYTGFKTKVVEMEERNVYCGDFNVLVLLNREDPSRVIGYSGGQTVAVGSRDGVVRLFDLTLLKEVPSVMQGHTASIRAVLLRQDRDLLISASYDLTIRCWSLKTGSCTKIFSGHMGTITCLDLHGERLVSGARDCKVKVWNLQTGQCYKTLKFRHRKPVVCVKVNASLLLSGCEGGLVKVWDVETATLLRILKGHDGCVKCLFFDQWHILSGGSDGQVLAWSTNFDFKKCLISFRHPGAVLTMSFLFLCIITGCVDGKVRIFNFLSGDCLRVIQVCSHKSPVFSLHTHQDNIVVNCSSRVVLLKFSQTRWDYSARPERKFGRSTPAPAHARASSSGSRIYTRRRNPPMAALYQHARSVSAPSMHYRDSVQQQPMRPKTCSRQSRAYADPPSKFIRDLTSAMTPGRPATAHTRDVCSRTCTSTSKVTCSEASTALMASERAARERVRKRGPHKPVTLVQVLLTVRPIPQSPNEDLATFNMKRNASVRDSWGPSSTSSQTLSFPPPASTLEQTRSLAFRRPQTDSGLWEKTPLRETKRAQTSCAVRRVGALTTTAQENVQTPPMLIGLFKYQLLSFFPRVTKRDSDDDTS